MKMSLMMMKKMVIAVKTSSLRKSLVTLKQNSFEETCKYFLVPFKTEQNHCCVLLC